MIHLTNKLAGYFLENAPRKIEITLNDGDAFIIGVPPKKFGLAWQQAMGTVVQESGR